MLSGCTTWVDEVVVPCKIPRGIQLHAGWLAGRLTLGRGIIRNDCTHYECDRLTGFSAWHSGLLYHTVIYWHLLYPMCQEPLDVGLDGY